MVSWLHPPDVFPKKREHTQTCIFVDSKSQDFLQQESPPAWTQEAYHPPRNKYTLCCSTWGYRILHAGTWPGLGGYPLPKSGWGDTPFPDLDGVTPFPGQGTPVQTWDGSPPHPDLGPGWGGRWVPHQEGCGYPPPHWEGWGYPPCRGVD